MTHKTGFWQKTIEILKDSYRNFLRDEPIVYSAAIAFFTIFSLPAILIVLTLAGSMFFSEETVRAEIVKQMEELMSKEVGSQVSDLLDNVTQIPIGFWSILIGLGFLLLMSLVFDAALMVFSDQLYELLEEHLTSAIKLIKTAFSILVVLTFFTAIHKILPDAKVQWRDALAGGIITSILFLIGKELINYILGSVKVVGFYAAAGSFVVVLLWVFYSSVILMLGAEVTKAYANNHGRKVEPSEIAERFEKVNGDKV
ncbi:YihY/virulence factor BrkB family protein [Pontibacter virosus]|uniref:Membrane protein n=1 Tax=Pontibacter virosus TaxID=1765052 RepID=A0A2U1B2M9_9BACT|nr:YihY/virulence factor BrkB family protein [Pontibacter virosus]PVY42861.1 membrane protein [Pontibacter virosus]